MSPPPVGLQAPNRSRVSNPYHLSSWNQPTGKGVNAGLRAQAGGPLGLSWGLSGLNLFWKQRKKPESCCGQIGRGFLAPHIPLVDQGDSGTALKSPLPPGPGPSPRSTTPVVSPPQQQTPPGPKALQVGMFSTRPDPTGASSSRKPCFSPYLGTISRL